MLALVGYVLIGFTNGPFSERLSKIAFKVLYSLKFLAWSVHFSTQSANLSKPNISTFPFQAQIFEQAPIFCSVSYTFSKESTNQNRRGHVLNHFFQPYPYLKIPTRPPKPPSTRHHPIQSTNTLRETPNPILELVRLLGVGLATRNCGRNFIDETSTVHHEDQSV